MSKKASRDTEQYVVRGGDSGSYDVLSGPYDSQDEAVNVSAMNDGSSTMSGTQLDSSSIGHDYRFGSYDGPNYVIKIDGEIVSYVEQFATKSSGERFKPHITIGVARADFVKKLEAEPFETATFLPAGVAIYQLGNFGTAQKQLWEWKPE